MVSKSSGSSPDTLLAPNHDSERATVTVVGIGNIFRGDDSVGLLVLRQLEKRVPAGVKTIELAGDQSYLLDIMRSTNAMIIVDAVQSSAPAGTIFRIDATGQPVPSEFVAFSTHAVDSTSAIELARALGLLPDKVLIYGIVGKDFSYTTDLTAEVSEAIEVAQAKILNDVRNALSEDSIRLNTGA